MSYNGIGLKSAKGSSTSGHIQRSLASKDEGNEIKLKNYEARKREKSRESNRSNEGIRKTRKPLVENQKKIISHLNKRQIEVSVSELRDKLEDDDIEEETIEKRCDELRKALIEQWETERRISNVYRSRAERLNDDEDCDVVESASKKTS